SLQAGGKSDGTNAAPCCCCEAALQHPSSLTFFGVGLLILVFSEDRVVMPKWIGETMANARSAIFSTKTGEQIGYVAGSAAYDLRDRKRFVVDVNKNLVGPATGQAVGQLRDGGPFTGSGEAADSLFD